MKKIIFSIFCFLSISLFGQDKTLDIDSKINIHLKKTRSEIGLNAKLLIDFDYDFNNRKIELKENDVPLNFYINPKKIKNKNYYLVKFMIISNGNKLILRAINFKIKKINNKKIELINLMNGVDYE